MACETWIDRMTSHLYGELEREGVCELNRHLETCEGCRESWNALAEAKDDLRAGAPDIPDARPLVVLGDRSATLPVLRWLPASIAAAAMLVAGAALAVATMRNFVVPADVDARIRTAVDERARAFEVELGPRIDGKIEAVTSGLVSRADLDERIGALRAAIEDRRRDDVDLLLAEIAATELRAGAALDATRRTLQYYALASDPGVTEW